MMHNKISGEGEGGEAVCECDLVYNWLRCYTYVIILDVLLSATNLPQLMKTRPLKGRSPINQIAWLWSCAGYTL